MKKIKSHFFKLPSHKRFVYEPRYYDPIKEELEQRYGTLEGKQAHYIAKEFMSIRTDPYSLKQNRQSKVRLLIIMGVLFLIAWLLYVKL